MFTLIMIKLSILKLEENLIMMTFMFYTDGTDLKIEEENSENIENDLIYAFYI